MCDELVQDSGGKGAGEKGLGGDASSKHLLVRGCDPKMAERAQGFLPPLIGNAQMTSCTDDDTFFSLLKEETKWDVICFAPGAMRWDAAGEAIPGGNAQTKGWSLKEYRKHIAETVGSDVPIVGTVQESEMVGILRQALGLD
jgi:hypothetical protein